MYAEAAFRRAVDRFPDRRAVVTPAGRTLTYAALDARTDALAAALDDRLGDARCAALLQNSLPAVESIVAALKRGRANAQLSVRGATDDLVGMVTVSQAEGFIFEEATADAAVPVLDRVDLETVLYAGAGEPDTPEAVVDYEAVAGEQGVDYEPDVGEETEFAVYFTSGTTSQPKAVPQNQEQAWFAHSQSVLEGSLDPEAVNLVVTPWYHGVTTLAWILPTFQVGATLVLQESFDPAGAVELIETHAVTGVLAVPTQVDAMVDAQIEGDYDVSSLEHIRTGGSVVEPRLVDRASEHLTDQLHNTYGMTEAFANLTHAYPSEQAEHPGTAGNRSFVWEDLRVVESAPVDADPDPEATVGQGETGEILARGPHCDGYVDNPAAEDRLFVDVPGDGGDARRWLRTGDIARVDEAGGLHIIDRIDNMIISGGENIYPQVVERVLRSHPAVEDAAVVGVPHERWGEQVSAVVFSDVSPDDLDAYCREHDGLADFKRPRQYAFTDEPLPRSDTGTLTRPAILDRHFG